MRLQLYTLGRSAAVIGDRTVGPNADLLFAGLLFFSLQSGRAVARVEVAELLWPHADRRRKAARLRWLLNRLKSLGLPLRADATHVSLPTDAVDADYRAVATLELESIGAVLPGYAADLSPLFARWLDEKREAIVTEVLRQLLPELVAAEQGGDWDRAVRVGLAVQRIDPLNEEATLALAEAQCRLGSKMHALTRLDAYIDAIGDDRSELRLPAVLLQRRIRNAQAAAPVVSEPAFVGRAREVERIATLITAAQRGAGGAVMVTGPAGIGKTRLIGEAVMRSAVGGLQVARVSCGADGATRFSGVVGLVTQILSLRGAVGASPSSFGRLSRLAALGTRPEIDTAGLIQEILDADLCPAVVDLLDAASAEMPVAVVVDDFQASDQATNAFWARLASWSELRPVAFLFAVRTSAASRMTLRGPTVSVRCMDQTDAAALIDDLMARSTRPANKTARAAILARGAGSPLFLRELVDQWMLTGSTDQLPGSLVRLLEAGLSSLSPAATRGLEAAAVLGPRATLGRMERAMQAPRGMFLNAIAELEAAGVLMVDAGGSVFGHTLWAEAAAKRMPTSIAHVLGRYVSEDSDRDREAPIDPSLRLLQQIATRWQRNEYLDRALRAADRTAEQVSQFGLLGDQAPARSNSVRKSFIISPRRS